MRKILIVDDEKRIRDLVEFRLQDKGFETLTANGGKEALEIVGSQRPDLVVLDVMMPDMSGLDVCRRIKAEDATKGVKVILLTAKIQKQDEKEGLSAGADVYITKPFSARLLVQSIEEVLSA
ncbi:MAG: response regulator [Proteobacteria bacterium]|nr:response regulator [Pseudomonadota bacterium]